MLRPGHAGMHQALIRLDNEMGIVNWGFEREESGAGIAQDAGPTRSSAEPAPEPTPARRSSPERVYTGTMGFSGSRPTRKTLRNTYAGCDEGVHFNWGLRGHEILPLPTLDEIEAVIG